jgi:hypothetical protein
VKLFHVVNWYRMAIVLALHNNQETCATGNAECEGHIDLDLSSSYTSLIFLSVEDINADEGFDDALDKRLVVFRCVFPWKTSTPTRDSTTRWTNVS